MSSHTHPLYNLLPDPLQMLEDEQILLQNLSFELLTPHPPATIHLPKEPDFQEGEQCGGRSLGIITEKKSPRRFYIDWNQAHNHHYFTKNEEEEPDFPTTFENHPPIHTNIQQQHKNTSKDYCQINQRLQMALNLIRSGKKKDQRSGKKKDQRKQLEKRSQSNEPHKEREVRGLTRTTCGFRGDDTKQTQNYEHLRFKTEAEEEGSFRENPFKQVPMEKYQTNLAIAQQLQHANLKESYKENTLRNKFLASIAQWQQKKERRIQERIQREMRLTMEGVTFTPEINPKSREIMKKKGTIAPIYERQHRDKKRQLTERLNVQQKAQRTFKPPPAL